MKLLETSAPNTMNVWCCADRAWLQDMGRWVQWQSAACAWVRRILPMGSLIHWLTAFFYNNIRQGRRWTNFTSYWWEWGDAQHLPRRTVRRRRGWIWKAARWWSPREWIALLHVGQHWQLTWHLKNGHCHNLVLWATSTDYRSSVAQLWDHRCSKVQQKALKPRQELWWPHTC